MAELHYVVLHHTGHGEAHFDLMIETDADGPLATWRLSDWPPGRDTRVTPLPPHRRTYLTFEGEVSAGRGRVRRVAAGRYECGPNGLPQIGVLLQEIADDLTRPNYET